MTLYKNLQNIHYNKKIIKIQCKNINSIFKCVGLWNKLKSWLFVNQFCWKTCKLYFIKFIFFSVTETKNKN